MEDRDPETQNEQGESTDDDVEAHSMRENVRENLLLDSTRENVRENVREGFRE